MQIFFKLLLWLLQELARAVLRLLLREGWERWFSAP